MPARALSESLLQFPEARFHLLSFAGVSYPFPTFTHLLSATTPVTVRRRGRESEKREKERVRIERASQGDETRGTPSPAFFVAHDERTRRTARAVFETRVRRSRGKVGTQKRRRDFQALGGRAGDSAGAKLCVVGAVSPFFVVVEGL